MTPRTFSYPKAHALTMLSFAEVHVYVAFSMAFGTVVQDSQTVSAVAPHGAAVNCPTSQAAHGVQTSAGPDPSLKWSGAQALTRLSLRLLHVRLALASA